VLAARPPDVARVLGHPGALQPAGPSPTWHPGLPCALALDGAALSATFVRELFRLYPPAWLQRFTVQKPLNLCGGELRPGDEAWTSPFVTQRLESVYPHPGQFDARRAPSTTAWAFFPFGALEGGAVERLVTAVVAEGLSAVAGCLRATAPGGMPPTGACGVRRETRSMCLRLEPR